MSTGKKIFGLLILALVAFAVAALITSSAGEGRAEYVIINGSEPETLDPHIATGVPEHRIFLALYEGLTERHPKTLEPLPGQAESWTLSEDGKTYTFKIRPDAKWISQRWEKPKKVTAYDFAYSWERCLRPETFSQYSYMLWYVENGEAYSNDRLRVLLEDVVPTKEDAGIYGQEVGSFSETDSSGEISNSAEGLPVAIEKIEFLTGNVVDNVVTYKQPLWDSQAFHYGYPVNYKEIAFIKHLQSGEIISVPPTILKKRQISEELLQDHKAYWKANKEIIEVLGFKALDEETFQVNLHSVTAFFPQILSHYSTYAVHMPTVDKYGDSWIFPENIASNGAFKMTSWTLNQSIRFEKNLDYWDVDAVALKTLEFIPSEFRTTSFNMFTTGVGDWTEQYPLEEIDRIKDQPWFTSAPYLGIYFYRINVTKPPMDDIRVRQAFNMALNKQEICEKITKAGQIPARAFVPTYLKDYVGYESVEGADYNVERARELLAEAGYPNGEGFPEIELLFNTSEAHRKIAIRIQKQLETSLNIPVRLLNQEWKVYLASQRELKYTICRAAWIGDYIDPNTFMDMFLTDGGNNNTGWSNARYDELISQANSEVNTEKRFKIFQEAEALLMEELPILPIYQYRSFDLVDLEKWDGIYGNVLNEHPPKYIRPKGVPVIIHGEEVSK